MVVSLDMTQQFALTAQKAKSVGLHPEQSDQQGEREDSAPLLQSCDTLPGVLDPALEP